MEQEEKRQLLIRDLSARLVYGVICEVRFKDMEGWKVQNMPLKGVFIDECYFSSDKGSTYSKEFKPYLRPMSTMTEKEKKELGRISCEGNIEHKYGIFYKSQDYLNSIHVDYRGLIPKGLAIEVNDKNNPYKGMRL